MAIYNTIVNRGITRRSVINAGDIRDNPPVTEVVTFEGITVTYLGEDVTNTERYNG